MGAYVDREPHRQLALLAERNERSLSAEVRLAVREHIEREQEELSASRYDCSDSVCQRGTAAARSS
jgi:hypothetical protein